MLKFNKINKEYLLLLCMLFLIIMVAGILGGVTGGAAWPFIGGYIVRGFPERIRKLYKESDDEKESN